MKKSNKSRKPKTELRNGCSRTEVYFSPSNYKSLRNKSDLEKDWFVECRFYDPKFQEKYPNGFQFRKRVTMFPTISERKAAMEIFKKTMEEKLDIHHWNPIAKKFMQSESRDLSPYTDVILALEIGRSKITGSANHLKQVRRCIARVSEALKKLNYSAVSIDDIQMYHVRNVLEELNLPPYSYNKFRQYLKTVFDELIEFGAVTKGNPCVSIRKKKTESKPREILTDEKFDYVFSYLREKMPEFFRYASIFFYSGARSTELFRVQKKHVNIEKQEYLAELRKGPKTVWETKVIVTQALPFWQSILDECLDDDEYLFSYFQCPGTTPVGAETITRKWNRHVKGTQEIKDEDGNTIVVTEDFYSLKHKFLDKLDSISQTPIIPIDNAAQIMANHTDNKTTGIYAVGRTKRKNEFLKKITV